MPEGEVPCTWRRVFDNEVLVQVLYILSLIDNAIAPEDRVPFGLLI